VYTQLSISKIGFLGTGWANTLYQSFFNLSRFIDLVQYFNYCTYAIRFNFSAYIFAFALISMKASCHGQQQIIVAMKPSRHGQQQIIVAMKPSLHGWRQIIVAMKPSRHGWQQIIVFNNKN